MVVDAENDGVPKPTGSFASEMSYYLNVEREFLTLFGVADGVNITESTITEALANPRTNAENIRGLHGQYQQHLTHPSKSPISAIKEGYAMIEFRTRAWRQAQKQAKEGRALDIPVLHGSITTGYPRKWDLDIVLLSERDIDEAESDYFVANGEMFEDWDKILERNGVVIPTLANGNKRTAADLVVVNLSQMESNVLGYEDFVKTEGNDLGEFNGKLASLGDYAVLVLTGIPVLEEDQSTLEEAKQKIYELIEISPAFAAYIMVNLMAILEERRKREKEGSNTQGSKRD